MNKLWIPVAGVAAAGLAALVFLLPQKSALSPATPELSANGVAAKTAFLPTVAAKVPSTHASRANANPAGEQGVADMGTADGRRAIEELTRQDPDAALAWAARIGDAAKRQQAQEFVCLTLAQTDPRRAVLAAIDTGLCDSDAGLLENLTAQWATNDFSAAHAWVRQQEASDWRDDLVARIAFAGSQSDPAAAAQLVVGEMAPGPKQNEAAISVLHQWALRDLGAAASWANAFPEGNLRTRALSEIECIRLSRQTAAAQP